MQASAMHEHESRIIHGDADMQLAGAELVKQLGPQMPGTVVTLSGELGAGKTTFCRGFIQACGYTGAVKSPTYTLIERYDTAVGEICHLDLYRLENPDELEFIGFRDLLEAETTLLIEWPERVMQVGSLATIQVTIEHRDPESRCLNVVTSIDIR